MTNPRLLDQPIAVIGNRSEIPDSHSQAERGSASLETGFPNETMIPENSGGVPPRGVDFNGFLYLMSSDLVHRHKGQGIQYDSQYAKKIGGYKENAVLASNKSNRWFQSTIDSNFTDPDVSLQGWKVIIGDDAIPKASENEAGIVKVSDNLTTRDGQSALSAKQGAVLSDLFGLLRASDNQIEIPNANGKTYIIKFGLGSSDQKTGSIDLPSPFPDRMVWSLVSDVIFNGSNQENGGFASAVAWRQDNSSKSQLGFTSTNPIGIFSYISIGY